MGAQPVDAVASFYDRYPYPPEREDLHGYAEASDDSARRRAEHTDLVLFVNKEQKAAFEQIASLLQAREIVGADAGFLERPWHHDLIVLDTSDTANHRA